MQNSSILPPATVTSLTVANETFDPTAEIPIANQSPHELCLDDLLKDDAYDKNSENRSQLISDLAENAFNDLAFNNLTINSNYGLNSLCNNNNFSMNFPSTLETINEDSIKELFGALR